MINLEKHVQTQVVAEAFKCRESLKRFSLLHMINLAKAGEWLFTWANKGLDQSVYVSHEHGHGLLHSIAVPLFLIVWTENENEM